jgi:hypothetical protein
VTSCGSLALALEADFLLQARNSRLINMSETKALTASILEPIELRQPPSIGLILAFASLLLMASVPVLGIMLLGLGLYLAFQPRYTVVANDLGITISRRGESRNYLWNNIGRFYIASVQTNPLIGEKVVVMFDYGDDIARAALDSAAARCTSQVALPHGLRTSPILLAAQLQQHREVVLANKSGSIQKEVQFQSTVRPTQASLNPNEMESTTPEDTERDYLGPAKVPSFKISGASNVQVKKSKKQKQWPDY